MATIRYTYGYLFSDNLISLAVRDSNEPREVEEEELMIIRGQKVHSNRPNSMLLLVRDKTFSRIPLRRYTCNRVKFCFACPLVGCFFPFTVESLGWRWSERPDSEINYRSNADET